MSILLDTNILTRSFQNDHPQFGLARTAVDLLIDRGERLCIVPQNLYEFWAVGTRPSGENGLGWTVPQVQARIARFKRTFVVLRDERTILAEWERLVNAHEVKGKTAHDARLVAAMVRHGLSQLLTFNASHFARFAGITVLTPEGVLAAST